MPKLGQLPEGGQVTLLDPGSYTAKVTNVFCHNSVYQGGDPKNRYLVDFEIEGEDRDGKPFTLWEFVTAGASLNEKHSGNLFLKKAFGRQLSIDEQKGFDPEWLIGTRWQLKIGTSLKQDGVTERNDIRTMTPLDPKPLTLESLEAHWKEEGKPEGEELENYPDNLVCGWVDADQFA